MNNIKLAFSNLQSSELDHLSLQIIRDAYELDLMSEYL